MHLGTRDQAGSVAHDTEPEITWPVKWKRWHAQPGLFNTNAPTPSTAFQVWDSGLLRNLQNLKST